MQMGLSLIAVCLLALPGVYGRELSSARHSLRARGRGRLFSQPPGLGGPMGGGFGAITTDARPKPVRDADARVARSHEDLTNRLRVTARVAESSGHLDRALDAWRRLVRLDPEKTDNYFELLNLLIRANDVDGAAPVLEQLGALLPSDPRPLYFRALVLRASGDADAFEATCRKALAMGANPAARLATADFFDRFGYPQIAELELKTLATGSGRSAGRAIVALAERAWILDDYAKALPYYQRADAKLKAAGMEFRRRGGAATGYRLRLCEAAVALERGDDLTALTMLRSLYEQRPDRIEAALLLIRQFRSRGETDLADMTRERTAAVFRRMVESNPGSSDAYNGLAWFLALADGDLDEAETLSRKSLAINPGASAYLDTLAEILHRKGNHADAVELIDDALSQRPAQRQYFNRQRQKFQQSLDEANE